MDDYMKNVVEEAINLSGAPRFTSEKEMEVISEVAVPVTALVVKKILVEYVSKNDVPMPTAVMAGVLAGMFSLGTMLKKAGLDVDSFARVVDEPAANKLEV